MKLQLPSVELVCVDGRLHPNAVHEAVAAIRYSLKDADFARTTFFSPLVDSLPKTIQGHRIKPIETVEDYSRFVLKELPFIIESEHCLVIQWDGFVVDTSKWRNDFLDYDYIGAPWPPSWGQCRTNRVGNGGFSLRSRRLMRRIAELDTPDEIIRLEDNVICLHHHKVITREGYQYAPADIAAEFSWENPIPEIEPNQSFGFHGRHANNAEYLKLALDYATQNI